MLGSQYASARGFPASPNGPDQGPDDISQTRKSLVDTMVVRLSKLRAQARLAGLDKVNYKGPPLESLDTLRLLLAGGLIRPNQIARDRRFAVLKVCREFRTVGLEMYYSDNVLIFRTDRQLQNFLTVTPPYYIGRVQQIKLESTITIRLKLPQSKESFKLHRTKGVF